LEAEYIGLEPIKNRSNKAKTEALASVRARWLPWQDDFRTLDWANIKRNLEEAGVLG